MTEQKETSPFELQQMRAQAVADAKRHFFEDAIVHLQREVNELRDLVNSGYAACEHIGIAGSYDNLKEGQRYAVAWLQTVNKYRASKSAAEFKVLVPSSSERPKKHPERP